jgi:excisionase family DNA binding protein
MENVVLFPISLAELTNQIENSVKKAISSITINIPKAEKPEDRLITRKELSELLDISLVTIHQRMKDGKLPFYKNGRRVYFKYDEVIKSVCKPE